LCMYNQNRISGPDMGKQQQLLHLVSTSRTEQLSSSCQSEVAARSLPTLVNLPASKRSSHTPQAPACSEGLAYLRRRPETGSARNQIGCQCYHAHLQRHEQPPSILQRDLLAAKAPSADIEVSATWREQKSTGGGKTGQKEERDLWRPEGERSAAKEHQRNLHRQCSADDDRERFCLEAAPCFHSHMKSQKAHSRTRRGPAGSPTGVARHCRARGGI